MTGAGGFDRSGTELYPRSTAGWFEDHVSPDVALGFARYAHATADERFRRDGAWRVLQGVADWIVSRVTRTGRGYELKDVMGIAETQQPIDNNAYTTMISTVVLREAIACARQIGAPWPPIWQEVADHLVLPRGTNTCRLVSHDDFDPSEDKGATPDRSPAFFR
ncbi:MAG: hypothetical protein JO057_03545 [Chloroflexi bacterium]|nr:hypothetical protein [Chloroflexota bacterium]